MKRLLCLVMIFCSTAAFAKDTVFPIHEPYAKVQRQYSKKGQYYDFQDLYAQMIWYATFASDEFREAFRQEYAKVYPQGQDGKAQERADPWMASDPRATFFVGLYAKKHEMTELGDKKSLQDITLEVDGRFYKPVLVEKIPVTQFEIYFFSYLNLWYKGYRVVFPYEGLRNREVAFKLHMNGVSGNSTLNFKAKH